MRSGLHAGKIQKIIALCTEIRDNAADKYAIDTLMYGNDGHFLLLIYARTSGWRTPESIVC